MQYRSEIDGLRAVAVLPVIAFHAGSETFSGGFVGVDVFFVISGYLITSILLKDLAQGQFSLIGFYDRRARRILPALFTVIVACIPVAWAWMTPLAFKDFGQSIAAVVLFASNFLFWWETDYFAAEAELKPLLHTWSLAIEEQFYLFFPLLLALFWKAGPRRLLGLIVVLSLASLAFGEWAGRNAPAANFYLPFSRVWELFAGAICAIILWRRSLQPQTFVSAVGLVAIFVAIFAFDGDTPFPSLYALLPVGGTAAIILFSGRTSVARLLSSKPLVGIGLISYSAYLWHQPLFAFARIRSVQEPSVLMMTGLSLLALGLAWLTWRFVEQPFRVRSGALRFSRRRVFALSGAAGAALLAFGVMLDRGEGLDWRRAPSGVAYADFNMDHALRINPGLDMACRQGVTEDFVCRTSDVPDTVLWGDSYAMHLAPALLASDPDIAMVQQTMSACAPIRGVSMSIADHSLAWTRECMDFNDTVLEQAVAAPGIRYVILSSRFRILHEDVVSRRGPVAKDEAQDRVLKEIGEMATLLRHAGKSPVFVSPPPGTGTDIGKCLTTAALFGDPESCDFTLEEFGGETRRVRDFLAELSAIMPIVMLDEGLCMQGICDMKIGDVIMYRDAGHLTAEGSAILGLKMDLADLIRSRANAFYADENIALRTRSR